MNFNPKPFLITVLIVLLQSQFLTLRAQASSGGGKIEPNIAKDVIPPSPTAAGLGQYGRVPVGMFTGTPNINIPLYTFKTKNLSVPISLSYSSNGIKVDQVASWVGIGWALNAGGVITRTVMDKPDERLLRLPPEEIKENDQQTLEFLRTYDKYYGFTARGICFIQPTTTMANRL